MTSRHGRLFWAGVVLGWGLVLVGVVSLAGHPPGRRGFLPWFAGGLLVHDLLVVPAVLATGWLVAKLVPAVARAPVQAGSIVSAALALVAYPMLRNGDRSAANPSALPQDYGQGLAVLLALTWLTVLVAVALATARRRRARA